VDAVKIGMLGDLPTIQAATEALGLLPPETPIVLDPVLVSESGAELLAPAARGGLIELLMPQATVTTPNLPEARALVAAATESPPDDAEAEELVRTVHTFGPRVVVLTGGHRERPSDLFFDGEQLVEIPGPRHPDGAAHGSGCTHSAVLAARLAWGDDPLTAARTAREMAARAVRDGLRDIGGGSGPVDVLGLAGSETAAPAL
jgi:hydroxymethylpyrimidine/phosphomethylpyrimidine kinase